MSFDPLVSDSESSSGAASPVLGAQPYDSSPVSARLTTVDQTSISPRTVLSEQDSPSREGTPNIQNEDLPTKVTLSASVVLSKIPPESSRIISKISEPNTEKITIRCQPIGSAPELTPNVFKISYHQPFATLIKFITNKIRKKSHNKTDSIHLYVNNSFAPSPDEIIGHLHSHFSANGELVVSYCLIVAFG